MAKPLERPLDESDHTFIGALHDKQELLFQSWVTTLDSKMQPHERLIVISKLRFTVIKKKFLGKAIDVEEIISDLTHLQVQALNNNFLITLKGPSLGEVCFLPPDAIICEHLTLTILQCVQRFRQSIKNLSESKKLKEDVPEEFSNKFEANQLTNLEKSLFAYKYYCARQNITLIPEVFINLPQIFKGGSNEFVLNKAIQGGNVQPSQLVPLIKSLENVTAFSKFEAREITLRSLQTETIGTLFKANQGFEHLTLIKCNINANSFKSLLEPMQRCTLKTLDVGQNGLKDAGIVSCKELLARIQIGVFHINNCELREKALDALGMIFRSKRWNSAERGLHRLSLAGNSLGKNGMRHLSSFIADEATCLRELSLSKCDVDMTPLLEAFCENDALAKEMKILNFSHNKINQKAADALSRLLLKVRNLKQLMLSDCQLVEATLKKILIALSSNENVLLDLDISFNYLKSILASILKGIEKWNPCLSGLIAEDCELTNEDVITICQKMCAQNKRLKLLCLDMNLRTNKALANVEAASNIAKCVTDCELEVLSLNGDKPSRKRSLTGGELRPIIESLSKPNKLTILHIQGNRMGVDGLHYLKSSLVRNGTLQEINLEDNKLDFQMAKEILQLAKPGPMISCIPIVSLKKLKHDLNKNQMKEIRELFHKAQGVLQKNREKMIRVRVEKGKDVENSRRSLLPHIGDLDLALPKDMSAKRVSTKLFSENVLGTYSESDLSSDHDSIGGRKSNSSVNLIEDLAEFKVARKCQLYDINGKVKGQLNEGTKVIADQNSKVRVTKKSIKSAEVWKISIKKPVDGWLKMQTYKDEPIIVFVKKIEDEKEKKAESASEDPADVETEVTVVVKIKPLGIRLELVKEKVMVADVQPGTAASAKGVEIGDKLHKFNEKVYADSQELLRSLQSAELPFTLTFIRVHKIVIPRRATEPKRHTIAVGTLRKAPPKGRKGKRPTVGPPRRRGPPPNSKNANRRVSKPPNPKSKNPSVKRVEGDLIVENAVGFRGEGEGLEPPSSSNYNVEITASGEWTCSSCTNVNSSPLTRCELCDTPKENKKIKKAPSVEGETSTAPVAVVKEKPKEIKSVQKKEEKKEAPGIVFPKSEKKLKRVPSSKNKKSPSPRRAPAKEKRKPSADQKDTTPARAKPVSTSKTPGKRKVGGKIGKLAMGLGNIPMPGAKPKYKKKKQQEAIPNKATDAALSKPTLQKKRRKRKRRKLP